MSKVIIRVFRLADEAVCRRIAAEAAMTSYGRSMPELSHVFRQEQPLDQAELRMVAEDDGVIVGFVELNANHIENLFVARSHQGKGIGSRLLQAAEATVNGEVTLSVFHSNPRARALYERLGYTVLADAEISFHGRDQKVWRMAKPRPSFPNLKGMIFDFDGVLADSAEWMVGTVVRLNREFGLQHWDAVEIETLRGLSNREIIRRAHVPIWKLPAMMRRGRELARQAGDQIKSFEGAETTLERIKARGLRLGLLSSNSFDRIAQTLTPETLAMFDHIETGASLFGKASRLKRMTNLMGLHVTDVAYIGDETRDVEAAQRAGLHPVAAGWGYAHVSTLIDSGTEHIVMSLRNLERWV